jgi:signal transduction histidine kinase
LRRIDQAIISSKQLPSGKASALHYLTTKERFLMYMKLRKPESAKEQLNVMESQAFDSGDETLKNDFLYNKAIYYYTFGQNEKGNAVFREMAAKLTAQKEYDKVDQVYQTLIANGRRSNSASLVAQAYGSYLNWKDSVSALKSADEIKALKQQIADNEASIADKDSSLSARWMVIVALGILAAALAAALIVGGIVLLRYILLSRHQKKLIRQANDNNALKSRFISNISAQLAPTLKRLDGKLPEVQALLDFSQHIQTLSNLENTMDEEVELEDVQVAQFCEELIDKIRDQVPSGVTLKVNAPKMSASINKEYVSHILYHLLENAVAYTATGGYISLDYKKRGAHSQQFIVSDTGDGIPAEQHEEVFKPFLQVRDLTEGDGLGLPICKQMALKMNGDLNIDATFTKGTRFVLDLHS